MAAAGAPGSGVSGTATSNSSGSNGPPLQYDAGAASAAAAAAQAKRKAAARLAAELRAAALTPPPQRDQAQVEALCDFIHTTHLLRGLLPTVIRTLAQALTARALLPGEVVCHQGEQATHLCLVLAGQVVLYEQLQDEEAAAAGGGGSSSGSSSASGGGAGRQLDKSGAAAAQARGSSRTPSGSEQHHHHHHHARATSRAGGVRGGTLSGAAGQAEAAPAAAADARQLSGQVEVRRVGPREAFGEDSAIRGGAHEHTAVAGCATAATAFRPPASGGSGGGGGTSTGGSHGGSGTGSDAQTVVLMLSTADYADALEGRLTSLLEAKVAFLTELPALKAVSAAYVRSLAACFHAVHFEPREVLVRQGDPADCLFLIKSGACCVLIDPGLTLTQQPGQQQQQQQGGKGSAEPGGAPPGGAAGDADPKKLVQVCLLGAGAIIGDMLVAAATTGGQPPRRSATVVALTEIEAFSTQLREFKRRMPPEVLDSLRSVAAQKTQMNETKAAGRAHGSNGSVLLGGVALPEAVLQGRGLRALWDATQGQQPEGGVPVGGLLDALELYCAASGGNSACSPPQDSSSSGSRSRKGRLASAQGVRAAGTRAAAQVDRYVAGLSRAGVLTTPPETFLALLMDWRSPRTDASTSGLPQVPPAWRFPLPLPGTATTPAAGRLHNRPTSAAVCWPQQPAQGPLLASPTSLLASQHLEADAMQHSGGNVLQQASLTTPSETAAAAAAAAGTAHHSPGKGAGRLDASVEAREATNRLLSGAGDAAPTYSRGASAGGGFKGVMLQRAHVRSQSGAAAGDGSGAPYQQGPAGAAASPWGGPEPDAHAASVKAALLFRPGSPICIGRCGSPRPQSASAARGARRPRSQRPHAAGSLSGSGGGHRSLPAAAAATLEGLRITAAVVVGRDGKAALDFHGATAAQKQQP